MPAPTVAIDADVLVAALLAPAGPSARLLQLGALGVCQPIISAEVLAEAEDHARQGIAGRAVTEGEWLAFRASLAELPKPESHPPTAGQRPVLAVAARPCDWTCSGAGAALPRGITPADLLALLLAET